MEDKDKDKSRPGLSRRRFVKMGGALAGMAAVGSLAACGDTTPTTAPIATTAATAASAATTTGTTAVATTAAAMTTIAGTAAATTGSAATTGAGGALPFAGRTITLFVYSGLTENTFRDVYAPAFEKATGAKIVLSAGWWDAAAKLKSSPSDQPPFDLVETDPHPGLSWYSGRPFPEN